MIKPSYLLTVGLILIISIGKAQNTSVLSFGQWFKIAAEKEGVYKIDYAFLQSIGLNPADINPHNIRIFGNGGKMLPQSNAVTRPVDLIENAIWVEGESDGSFDSNDYILFYAQSPDSVDYDATQETFVFNANIFEDQSYYFLTIGDVAGKRIGESIDQGLSFPNVSTYDYYEVFHEDKTSVLISGREWYGDRFDSNNENTYDFEIPDLRANGFLKITSAVMAQSYAESSFDMFLNGSAIGSQSIAGVTTYQYGQKGLNDISVFESQVPSESFQLKLRYNRNNSDKSLGYLNYILVHAERNLKMSEEPIVFKSIQSLSNPLSTFTISNANTNTEVWDLSNPFEPKRQVGTLSGSNFSFGAVTVSLTDYVVFDKSNAFIPEFVNEVENQNIHAVTSADLLIVCHKDFREEAERLASFRRSHDGLEVVVVTTEEVYNEFSSGSMDFTAIRDYAKHIYDQGGLKHLLLFGKGTYDYKDNYELNLPLVPIYESRNSLHPLRTYSSDDYFGFMEDDEGDWIEEVSGDHTLDIGVGRLPVKDLEEAQGVVDKLIDYAENATFGRWKNKVVFVADDGDANTHQRQAHELAFFVDTVYSNFDTDRLFLDNFKQESQPAGERSDEAENALNRMMEEGALIVNYTGHGGESGWTQEAILDNFMIEEWDNQPKYPLFVTATCEFGRNDDPRRESGGEKTILNPKGGAIALVTTARPVNSSTNFELNKAFYNAIFAKENGIYLSLGDIFKETKNNSLKGSSNRNFSLLGDPSMRIAYPNYSMIIDEINGKDVLLEVDTLQAQSLATISGHVSSYQGAVQDFNGIVNLTVYDKLSGKETLGNENQPFSYQEWDNILFNGQASVVDGYFEMSFVVPKNIEYNTGKGRISMYAYDDESGMDAHGATIEVPIGQSDASFIDNTPPGITLYINDTTFIEGGYTSENVLFLAKLEDESGINTSSSHVGNSLSISLDGEEAIIANKYYLGDLDSYQSGWVAFPINDLEEGYHEITFTASDTYNNNASATIQFIVSEKGKLLITELGNYPNPVGEQTKFFVTHNRAGEDIQIDFKIIKLTGEVVESFSGQFLNSNSTIHFYEMNSGEHNFTLGTYVYSVKMRSLSDAAENIRFQKFIKVY